MRHHVPHLLYRVHIMRPLILLMVSNATLRFTYCGLVAAGQTRPQLHCPVAMNVAKHRFVLRMTSHHQLYNSKIITWTAGEHQRYNSKSITWTTNTTSQGSP